MQTKYDFSMGYGVAGQLVDLTDKRIDSFVCEGGKVKPGFGVVAGSTLDYRSAAVRMPSASTDKFVGVVIMQAKEQQIYTGEVVFNDAESLNVVNGHGRVYVPVIGSVTAGDKAALIFSGDNAGKFCSASNATITDKITTKAVLKMTQTTDEIGIIELRQED